MKIAIFLTLPLLALASVLPAAANAGLERRVTAADIINDLRTLEKDLQTLDDSVVANPVNIGTVQNNEQKVEVDFKRIITDVNNSPTVSSLDCDKIYNELKNKLVPLIKKLTNDFIVNKSKFATVKSAVKTDLQNLANLVDQLRSALAAKLTGSCRSDVITLLQTGQQYFTNAASQYS